MSAPPAADPKDSEDGWPPCPFWDWALAVYAGPGIEDACLDLQDRGGHDVVLVLFARWLAECGILVDGKLADRARSVSASWQHEVVRPLRSVRRGLKLRLAAPNHLDAPEALQPALTAQIRQEIQAQELAAERLQILALANLARDRPSSDTPAATLAYANLHRLIDTRPEDRRSLATVVAAQDV